MFCRYKLQPGTGILKIKVYRCKRESLNTKPFWNRYVMIRLKSKISWCAFFLFILANGYGQVNWQVTELVPGGRFDAVADLGNGTVIMGSRSPDPGHIFRSTDYGVSWAKLDASTREENTMHNNGILCMAGGRGDDAYLITTNAQIWRSEDRGLNWKKINLLKDSKDKYVYPYGLCVTPLGTILATTDRSIYRSTDRGLSFERIGPISDSNIYRLQLISDGIIVNGWDGTLYRSVDDGRTWQSYVKADTSPLFATEYLGSYKILQGAQSGNIYAVSEGSRGGNSKKLAGLKGAADDFVYLGYHTVIYSTYTEGNHIYISYDDGNNWQDIGPIPTGVKEDWLDHEIKLDKEDSVIVIGGTHFGFVARAAFSRDALSWKSNPPSANKIIKKKKLKKAVVGMLTDHFELNEPEDILLDGNYAYVPCRAGHSLAVIDISDPQKPGLAESFRDEELREAMGVDKFGPYIFLTSMGNERCLVLNAEDPANLKKIYSFPVGGADQFPKTLRKVSYVNGYLYFTHDGEGALYIADAHNPEKPEIISKLQMGNGAFAVKVVDDIAYIGGCVGSSSVKVVDVSDKRNPVLLHTLKDAPKYDCVCEFDVSGNRLYAIGNGSNSFIEFDISDPGRIREINRLESGLINRPNRFVKAGKKVYIVNHDNHSVVVLGLNGDKIKLLKANSSWLFQKGYGINYRNGLLYVVGRDAMNFVILNPDRL